MFAKWQLPGKPLSARAGAAHHFCEVFTAPTLREASAWPDIPEPQIPPGIWDIDFSTAPLNELQRSMAGGAGAFAGITPVQPRTQGEAIPFLRGLEGLPGQNPHRGRLQVGRA